MKHFLNRKNVHIGFHISLILKGLFDTGEVLSGILMIFMTPDRVERLIAALSKEELLEDPNDFVMNYLVSYSHVFSMSTQHFTSLYLLSHGLIKILALILLWNKKLWAYPLSCIMFLGFIVIQIQRFTHTFSVMLIAVTLLDVIMLLLTILEYKNIRKAA